MGVLFWDEGQLRAVTGYFSHLSFQMGAKRPFVKKDTTSLPAILEIYLKNGDVITKDALWSNRREVSVKTDSAFVPFDDFIKDFSKDHLVRKSRVRLLTNEKISSYVKVSDDDYHNTNRVIQKALR